MISVYLIGLITVGAILWAATYVRNKKYRKADTGQVTLHVSGALQKTWDGYASFDLLELDKDVLSDARIWVISMHDEWSQKLNFQLSLSSLCNGGLTQPIPGSYAIASGSYGSTRAFSASYSHIVVGDNLDIYEYSTLHEGSGVLIIETVNDREIHGNFIFTAHRYENPLTKLDRVEVTGKFTARKPV